MNLCYCLEIIFSNSSILTYFSIVYAAILSTLSFESVINFISSSFASSKFFILISNSLLSTKTWALWVWSYLFYCSFSSWSNLSSSILYSASSNYFLSLWLVYYYFSICSWINNDDYFKLCNMIFKFTGGRFQII